MKLTFENVELGIPYEEDSLRPDRKMFFFISQKNEKYLYVEVTHYQAESAMIARFDVISKNDWEVRSETGELISLFPLLERGHKDLAFYRTIILEIFEPHLLPKWQSLGRAMKNF